MTEHRLRELLSEVADTVPRPDMAEQAWRRSVRVRRRRVAGTALLAVGVVVAVVGAVGVLNDGAGTAPDRDGQTDPVAPPPVPEAALSRDPDARGIDISVDSVLLDDARAWVGPTVEEEANLPYAGWLLPSTIDLADSHIETTDAPGPAVAAVASSDSENLLEEVLLLGRDGDVSRLPVGDLDLDLDVVEKPDPDGGTTSVLPLNISSLSPDGKRLVFAQNDAVVVYDLVTGDHVEHTNEDSESYYVGWAVTADYGLQIQLVKDLMDPDTGFIRTIPSSGEPDDGDDDGSVVVYPLRYNDDQAAGAMIDQPVPELGSDLGTDSVLITVDGQRDAMMALPVADGEHIRPRSRVVDWLGDDVVAFQSQDSGTYRVLGWDIKSGAVSLLTDTELPDDWDEGVAATWADLSRL